MKQKKSKHRNTLSDWWKSSYNMQIQSSFEHSVMKGYQILYVLLGISGGVRPYSKFECLFVVLRPIPLFFLLMWKHHHYRWMASTSDLYTYLMAMKQQEFFSVPHQLWHGNLKATVSLTPIGKKNKTFKPILLISIVGYPFISNKDCKLLQVIMPKKLID